MLETGYTCIEFPKHLHKSMKRALNLMQCPFFMHKKVFCRYFSEYDRNIKKYYPEEYFTHLYY